VIKPTKKKATVRGRWPSCFGLLTARWWRRGAIHRDTISLAEVPGLTSQVRVNALNAVAIRDGLSRNGVA